MPALTQTIDFYPITTIGEDKSWYKYPDDLHARHLKALSIHAPRSDLLEELARLELLYPGKYTLPIGFKGAPLTRQKIRAYLTYWDVIDHPTVTAISDSFKDADTEIQTLIDQGFILRTKLSLDDHSGWDTIVDDAHLKAYEYRNTLEPNTWSMARDSESLRISTSEDEECRGVSISLFDCLPVPDASVPIHEVLEFRVRERDLLLALRSHLESIYLHVANSEHVGSAISSECRRLDAAVTDYVAISQSRGIRLRMFNVASQLKLEFDLRAGVAGGVVAIASGLPMTQAILAGVGVSLLPKIEVTATVVPRSISPSNHPFEYITSLQKELSAR